MDLFQRMVRWNEERNLLAPGFDYQKETSFILEELLESTGKYDSFNARKRALELSEELLGDAKPAPEEVVDAWADIIIFATGAIAKSGYDPSLVMEEVFKEIDSRKGSLVNGKFVRDEFVSPYKADLAKCRLPDQK